MLWSTHAYAVPTSSHLNKLKLGVPPPLYWAVIRRSFTVRPLFGPADEKVPFAFLTTGAWFNSKSTYVAPLVVLRSAEAVTHAWLLVSCEMCT